MAIEINNRTKILAGVVVLAAVGYGAWFFFLDDFLNEPPPKAPAATSAPAGTAKQADAAKPAADAPKQADAAKPAADAPKPAAAARPGAKPIPSNPDQLIAEVIETSGMKGYFSTFAREAAVRGGVGDPGANPAVYAAVVASVDKAFEPAKLTGEIAANLKANGFDAERMARFLELLRQPVAVKMSAPDARSVTPEAMKEHFDGLRKNPLPAARVKLLQTLDEATMATDVGADMTAALQREMIDVALDTMKKGGKDVPPEARQMVGSQLTSLRNQGRILVRAVMYVMYRQASDEDLSDYVKLLDTDTGRWGSELLANAMRPALVSRGSMVGREVAPLATSRAMAGKKEPAAPQPVVRQEEKPVEKRVAAPVAAAVEAPGYRRPANVREAYSRYNDLISATVMRDRAAVKELLDDGKNPNARQSDGITPLMIAVSNGDADIATMLLAKGADPNLRAGSRSALSIAKSRGATGTGMVQLLERSGARN